MPSTEHFEAFEAQSPRSGPPFPGNRELDEFVENADANDEFVEDIGSPAENKPASPLSGEPLTSHDEFAEHVETTDHANPDKVGRWPADGSAAGPPTRPDSDGNAHVEHADQPQTRPSMSRRSTIMLQEDELPNSNHHDQDEGPLSRAREGEQVDLEHPGSNQPRNGLVETVIEWKDGGNSVFVTGSFTGWRQMIPLRRLENGVFVVVLKLAPGTHRLRFVVDGELRCSDDMNTATDSMGNLVNYMEIGMPRPDAEEEAFEDGFESHPEHEYTRQIPEIFADPEALDRFSSIEFTPPPQLPPHLDSVILNTNWVEKDNNSVLPIPNHVVLNHLATTSIKHNVLAVASVARYHAKYVTQILYSPIEGL